MTIAALEYATAAASLALAAWTVPAVVRNRFIDRSHLIGLAVVELFILIGAGIAVAALVNGERPAEFATFLGYLATIVLLPPAALSLALMERTRWGSVIVLAAALTCAVLVLRLDQVWHG